MLTTLHIGLSTIGLEVVKAGILSGFIRPIAGVDPAHAGKKLSEIPEAPAVEVEVYHDIAQAVGALKPDVAIISTFSKVEAIAQDLRHLCELGINVVSTCETLTYPWLKSPELANELDQMARDHGVSIVGTGVNPGFVLDALPVMLTRPCETIEHVRGIRVVDTSLRRRQLQQKTGSGLSVEEFRERAKARLLGHVGLPESAALIAKALRWDLKHTQIEESLEPIIVDRRVETEYLVSEPDQAKGHLQKLTIHGERGKTIHLELRMELGAAEEYDEIEIEGIPPIHARIIGGIFGDSATAGCTVNILRQTVAARPGLLTVLDLPLV